MPAVRIVAVRVKEHGLAVTAKRPLLDLAIPRSQQFRLSAGCSHRVKMLPAILLTGENDAISGGPVDDAAPGIVGHVGVGIRELVPAVPDLLGIPSFGVRY